MATHPRRQEEDEESPERRRDWVAFWGATALLFYLMTLGPTLSVNGEEAGFAMPYSILQSLPLFNVGRDPGRFNIVALLGMGYLAALGLRSLYATVRSERFASGLARVPGGPTAVVALISGAFIAFTVAPFMAEAGNLRIDQPDWPPFYETLERDPADYAVLELPLFATSGRGEHHYQVYQALHDKYRLGGRYARPQADQPERLRQDLEPIP